MEMPSRPTLSRFGTKLSKRWNSLAVKNVFRKLTLALYDTLPDFGKSVAIDATDVKGWSNAGQKGKRTQGPVKRHPRRPGKVSDPDAGWCVKTNTEGNKKYVWGYKVHIFCDTTYELPLAIDVTAGNVNDIKKATPLLQQARFTSNAFKPSYVMCDAGYSSDALRRAIKQQYWAQPLIDARGRERRPVARNCSAPCRRGDRDAC